MFKRDLSQTLLSREIVQNYLFTIKWTSIDKVKLQIEEKIYVKYNWIDCAVCQEN